MSVIIRKTPNLSLSGCVSELRFISHVIWSSDLPKEYSYLLEDVVLSLEQKRPIEDVRTLALASHFAGITLMSGLIGLENGAGWWPTALSAALFAINAAVAVRSFVKIRRCYE